MSSLLDKYPELKLPKPPARQRRVLECKECEVCYDRYSSWYSHMQRHATPKYSCPICEEPFTTTAKRNSHYFACAQK